MERGIFTIPEWLFDSLNEKAKRAGRLLVGEYENGFLDHTKIRVEEVLQETAKAYKVVLDAETYSGSPRPFTAWLPKSVILK